MKRNKPKILAGLALIGLAFVPISARAEADKWTFDVTLYGLAAGMSGDVTVKGVPADVDVGFDEIWDHLQFGAMGKVRVGYDRWALNADVIYMDLEAEKNNFSVEMAQWVVEPSLSYRVCPGFELLAGARYNNLDGEINGPLSVNPSDTQDWWDPIVGVNVTLPLGEKFSFNVRGDIGGFEVGSDLTWQAFPSLSWHITKHCSLNAGYRWVYTDYESGSGANEFKYDILSQGPQLGITFHF